MQSRCPFILISLERIKGFKKKKKKTDVVFVLDACRLSVKRNLGFWP